MIDPVIGCLCTGVVATAPLFFGLRLAREYRLIRDLPQSHAGGVFIGLVEVTGRVECARPVTSFLAENGCVWYRYTVEERWTRTETVVVHDKRGSHTETRTTHGWDTVDSGGNECCFDLVDDTGQVQVDPAGARVDAVQDFNQECGRGDALYYGKGPSTSVRGSDGIRRYRESVLPLGLNVFVIGQARERADVAGAEIARDPHAVLFVISAAGEKSVERGFFWWALCLQILGLALSALAPWALYAQVTDAQSTVEVAFTGGAAYAVAWLVGEAWLIQFGLIELRNRVRQGWANIDVQLKRRYDLITRILPVVQAYCAHEAGAQAAIAHLRGQLLATAPGRPGPDPAGVTSQIVMLAEKYPNLQAQAQFQELHKSLVDCENRISLARGYFNDIATNWNTRRERVPDCLIAMVLGMKAQALMTALGNEQQPVTVTLAPKPDDQW